MALTIAGIEVPHIPLPPVDRQGAALESSTSTLPPGHCKTPGARPLLTPTIFEQDIKIPLRDGTLLRADVFRPTASAKVPALIAWSPYGKTGAGLFNLATMPGRAGVPASALSGYESFEGPDPAEWVSKGYAIVNVDARGAFNSEGDVRVQGAAEGRDGYDAVEFVAEMSWCNECVGMVGNSWLAMVQFHIAAQNPPHLKCIAPLEGQSDMFREGLCRGGIPAPNFFNAIVSSLKGPGQIEDLERMLDSEPVLNGYWQDKRVDFSKIRVPAYVLASYSTGLHTEGSLRCFEEMTAPAWLIIHDTQEWFDLYSERRTQELVRFFDRYLKRERNGWEETPRARVSLLGFNQPNVTNCAIPDWPHPQTRSIRLFLGPGKLMQSSPAEAQTLSYQSDFRARQDGSDSEQLHFRHAFDSRTYLLGTSTATLYVSCLESDDFDVFVQLGKADAGGNLLESYNIPQDSLDKAGMPRDAVPAVNTLRYLGPTGMLRASRRALDETLSKPHAPQLSFGAVEKVPLGDVTKLTIGIWAGGIVFEEGEQLVLKVSGHPMTLAELPMLWGAYRPANRGEHHVHFGGKYKSHVDVPTVPSLTSAT